MEETIVFGLVLTFVVGGMMLALVMGYLSTEQARAEAESHSQLARTADAIPGFLAKSVRDELPSEIPGFDDALLARLESHVREEQALVSQFVHHPSIHSLYRQGPQALRMH
jgi:hypothetical protein